MVLARLGQPPPPKLAAWLLSCHHADGGFSALPSGPIPDLLSTATSLHALAAMMTPLDAIAPACRRFVRGLQSPAGGFAASMADPAVDSEYTFYGLLALGHLA
jgi:prenyltransferase beta subunit